VTRTASRSASLLILSLAISGTARAGEADVVAAVARCQDRVCQVDATIRHADAGWQHYADHFRVLAPDGQELARRVLLHPHVEEQPFTRSQAGVVVPGGVSRLWVEAHDSVHGYGGRRAEIVLPWDVTTR